MNKQRQLKSLEKRAKAALLGQPISPNGRPRKNSETDLQLYEMELELQNCDLRESEMQREAILSKYLNLYNLAPISYFILNSSCLIIEVNHAGANLLNLDKSSLTNKCFSRYIAPDSQMIFSNYKTAAFNDMNINNCEVKLLRRNSPIFYAELEGKAVFNPTTGEKELFLFVLNISERKKSERDIQNTQQKLAITDRHNSLNELASTIAHELNTPLAIILNYVQGCIRRIESGNFAADDLLNALKATAKQSSRASEIILRLKNFKQQGMLKTEMVCVDTMVKEVINLINLEVTDSLVTIFYRPSKFPDVKIDRVHIQQVILNLARNALEAMRDSNTVDPRIIIETNRITKNEIEINVIDNGPGFNEEKVHQLFDPHFTTKDYGIGLGLAVSQSIIKAHGSEIIAKLNPVGGSCFSFTLKSLVD
jgi:signal transduction histidine kinase